MAETPMSQNILPDLLSRKANIRTLRAQNIAPDLLERQTLLLCGKHAINHVLQEEKLDWRPKNPQLLLTGSRNPLNRDTRINLARFCDTYFAYFRAVHQIPADADCDLINGNISSDVIQILFTNMLQYSVDAVYFSVDRTASLRKVQAGLERKDCLGVVINIGGYHWTAISQYLNSCRKRHNGRLEKFKWAYIDSQAPSIYECSDSLAELLKKYGGNFVQAILIYNRPRESYYSVAAERMATARSPETHLITGVYAAPSVSTALAAAVAANNTNSVATYKSKQSADTYRSKKSVTRRRAPTPKPRARGGSRSSSSKRQTRSARC
jgi:hypothetical protein